VNDGSHQGVACDVSVGLFLLIILEVLRNSTSKGKSPVARWAVSGRQCPAMAQADVDSGIIKK
jgi:hypothetical protein